MQITPEIEAVARAIYDAGDAAVNSHGLKVPYSDLSQSYKKHFKLTDQAIAAIRAMRELTTGMYCAGACVSLAALPLTANPDVIFTAMIDAALGDNE